MIREEEGEVTFNVTVVVCVWFPPDAVIVIVCVPV